MNAAAIDAVVAAHLGKVFPAAAVVLRQHGAPVYRKAFGLLDPEAGSEPASLDTFFDLASVSKLFCVAAFMALVDDGLVTLDTPVRVALPAFSGPRPIAPYPDPLNPGGMIDATAGALGSVDASAVTFRHLLAHNGGLPAWLPFWRLTLRNTESVAKDEKHLWRVIENPTVLAAKREDMRAMALNTAFAYPIGTRVVYSDVGLILIGMAVQALTGKTLDTVVAERVAGPLGIRARYGPLPPEQCAPTEVYAHQPRRMRGAVHDENCYAFGGVTGHAGVFATADDVCAFGEHLRQCLAGTARDPILRQSTLREMTRLQAEEAGTRRGLGFALWSPLPRAASNPLDPSTFGHLGFTGTALWIDPSRALSLACLTNHVYYGRNQLDAQADFRVAFGRAVVAALEG